MRNERVLTQLLSRLEGFFKVKQYKENFAVKFIAKMICLASRGGP